MKKETVLKVVGVMGTVMGIGATLISDYSNKKTMEKTVTEKVAEALAEAATKSNGGEA